MSKPLTFIKKVKLFHLYLKAQQNGVIIDCALCGSTNISFEKQTADGMLTPQINDKGLCEGVKHSTLYYSIYTCNDCGAECSNRQEWYKS